MRRQAGDDVQPGGIQIVSQLFQVSAGDTWVDQQHTAVAHHGDGIAADPLALTDPDSFRDLGQHASLLRFLNCVVALVTAAASLASGSVQGTASAFSSL